MSEAVERNAYTTYAQPTQILADALGVEYDATGSAGASALRTAIDWLVAEVRNSLNTDDLAAIEPALKRLAALSPAPEHVQREAMDALAEDVYLLRAMLTDRSATMQLLADRRFLDTAPLPDDEPDLQMDLAIAAEQSSFATIVHDPARIGSVLAAANNFRRRYVGAYLAHHAAYWDGMMHVHSRLLGARPRIRSLVRLNSLTDLGPAVGEQTVESIENLIHEATECSFTGDLAEAVGDDAVCPGCRIVLSQTPAIHSAEELIGRLDRAIERQMSRLSSVAIREVLERSTDPRVERFLRVVQASQLSSLADVLDEQLTNYIRRFLLEARIHALLDPMLDQVERGETPTAEDSRDKLGEVARLVEQATKASQRKLPPGGAQPE